MLGCWWYLLIAYSAINSFFSAGEAGDRCFAAKSSCVSLSITLNTVNVEPLEINGIIWKSFSGLWRMISTFSAASYWYYLKNTVSQLGIFIKGSEFNFSGLVSVNLKDSLEDSIIK